MTLSPNSDPTKTVGSRPHLAVWNVRDAESGPVVERVGLDVSLDHVNIYMRSIYLTMLLMGCFLPSYLMGLVGNYDHPIFNF